MSTPLYEVEHNSPFDNPNHTGSPERRLMLAILERAILDFVGNDPREIQGASDWIFSEEDDQEDEFSFNWVCSELDLDASQIASYISAMPKRGNNRVAPWYLTKTHPAKEASEKKKVFSLNSSRGSNSFDEPLRKAS